MVSEYINIDVFRGVEGIKLQFYLLCFVGVCSLILGKWLVFLKYGGVDCLWHLVEGVNVLLSVATECFYTTVHWEEGLVRLRPFIFLLGNMSLAALYNGHGELWFQI
jgi:hypothetical protein